MHASTILASALLATLSTAAPATRRATAYTDGDACGLTDFYLVTTTSSTKAWESKSLPNVSATSLFDPFYAAVESLRTIAPGYNELPSFNLTRGQLHTLSAGPHGVGDYVYNSTFLPVGGELGFAARPATKGVGALELIDGYLLNVRGSGGAGKGWTLCDDPSGLGESVIYWKGTNASCKPTFIQAVAQPPY